MITYIYLIGSALAVGYIALQVYLLHVWGELEPEDYDPRVMALAFAICAIAWPLLLAFKVIDKVKALCTK